MNYLAHIFLSGRNSKIQIGNFIGDAVKGRSYNEYPDEIRSGILLHRAIDDFTDNHPLIKKITQEMKPSFGRYSGVLLDIYFDYLLASGFRHYSGASLSKFSKRFYFAMVRNRKHLPERIRRFMWHFMWTDRLGKYATINGIRESLSIMFHVRHISISVDDAVEYLEAHEKELRIYFQSFFAELQKFCDDRISSGGQL